MEANRLELRESEETIRIIRERLKTADQEPKRGKEALEEIRARLKQPAPK